MSYEKIKKQSYKSLLILFLAVAAVSAQIDSGYARDNSVSIKTVTIKKTDKTQNSSVDIEYPQVDNIKNPVLKNIINQDLKKKENDLLYWFNKNVADNNKEAKVKFTQDNQNTLDISYEKIFLSDKILSLNIYCSTYFYGSAHPNSESYTYNYDLSSGSPITLSSIFKKNSNYLKKISDYCINQIIANSKKNNIEPDMQWIKEGAGPKEDNFKYFNLTDKELLIVFQDYQVTSHAEGPPTIRIPLSKFKDIINPKYL